MQYKHIFHICSFLLLLVCPLVIAELSPVKQQISKAIDAKSDHYSDLAHQVWSYAEVGYKEHKSTELLQGELRAAGFEVEAGVAGIPTSFVASFGSGKPVIGILGEFDALPGLSQRAVGHRSPLHEGAAGHACGHHMFGVGSLAAAIAIKNWLNSTKQSGTIRYYGTPAEEGGSGKVYMVREGLFDDVDTVLNWHPGPTNTAMAMTSLANKSARFNFHGVASHAAAAPERGRSALDGVEAMNYMVNMLREHMDASARVHYVITQGGEAPNIVPEYAQAYYYVRHPDYRELSKLWNRIIKAAEAAALGTETSMDYEVMHGNYNKLPNETVTRLVHANLNAIGGIDYTVEEQAFAEAIQKTFAAVPEGGELGTEKTVLDYGETSMGGSTDVGDVSWLTPTTDLGTATWVPGTAPHSWQAVAAGGTTIGTKGMLLAAKVLAMTAVDLYSDPEHIVDAKKELERRRGKDFRYKPLLGTRKPALDYRD